MKFQIIQKIKGGVTIYEVNGVQCLDLKDALMLVLMQSDITIELVSDTSARALVNKPNRLKSFVA